MNNEINANNVNEMSINNMQSIMSQLVTVSKSNTEGVAVIMQDITNMKNVLGGLANKINNQGDAITTIQDDIEFLKLNEEITEEQANIIRTSANKRVAEILHYNDYEMAKYFRTFIAQLWKYLKKYGSGSEYRRTKKRNFQTVLDRVEAWIPEEGVQALKDRVDRKAEAKRKALENGYDK